MRIIGKIHNVDLSKKLIGISTYKRIIYFYFQGSLLNTFRRYLYPNNYIDLDYDESKIYKKSGINSYLVNFVSKIFSSINNHKVSYFDKTFLNNSMSSFLSGLGNMMFLDLEMTMPAYGFHGQEYKTEIIQVGYLLVDNNGEEITRYSNYLKPRYSSTLSRRTLEFLSIEQDKFDSLAIDYHDFYEEFKEIIEIYHPSIIIYGKNDSIILNNSFMLNEVPTIENIRYVNICRLIKNFYNLKNEPGLFKLYQIYYHNEDLQIHDAFNDCFVTKEVFKAFKDDVNHETYFYDIIRDTLEPKKEKPSD